MIGGDVFKVPGSLGAIGDKKLCFRKNESSERTFKNAQVHKVYVEYEAYLSTDTSGAVAWIDLKTAKRADDRVKNLENEVQTLNTGLSNSLKIIPSVINPTKIENFTDSDSIKYIHVYINAEIKEDDVICLGVSITFNSSQRWLNCVFPANDSPDCEYNVFSGDRQVGVGYDSSNKRIRIVDRSNATIFNNNGKAKVVLIK